MGEREGRGRSDRPDRGHSFGGPRGNRMGKPRSDQHRHGGPGGGRPSNQYYLPRGTVVYILDILQHGGVDKPGQHSWNPIAQVLEVPDFRIYEMFLNKGKVVALQEKVITGGDDSSIGKVQRRLKFDNLTATSSEMLHTVLTQYINENEQRFIAFLNTAGPITIKRHSLEVLPGVGKKLMWDIVSARERELFKNFDDVKARVPGFKPQDTIAKRIVEEMANEDEKHFLFVKHNRPHDQQLHSGPLQHNPFQRRI